MQLDSHRDADRGRAFPGQRVEDDDLEGLLLDRGRDSGRADADVQPGALLQLHWLCLYCCCLSLRNAQLA